MFPSASRSRRRASAATKGVGSLIVGFFKLYWWLLVGMLLLVYWMYLGLIGLIWWGISAVVNRQSVPWPVPRAAWLFWRHA